ncbi:PcF and SCR74-like cys-rich secreted peptide [Phytophthora megakarya]|uniref:PcF and SCR74-like cys-rich secreted peptide n=1 Tax=Phytophthora megakarya TaxID=4795 RepID=A0A225USX4_9STRA|nr:PcF and SCR74-like cys-rich secreted peptide [Phytophthora megakarya]
MNFKTCFAVLLAAAIATSVPANAQQVCRVQACGSPHSDSTVRISDRCKGRSGDFDECCSTSCRFGNPC